ncbi:Ig-like domain-containing protein [Aliiglaciecola sp. SL4]|uniref:Ig-like domain-containing protein n=1 Tax=Aliiglaciecola sp. SL4 TaxID=3239806 RepID=UPI00355B0E84
MASRLKMLFAVILIFTLSACGGGGSVERDSTATDTGGSDSSVTYDVNLSIADQDGGAVNELTSTSPLVVTATVSSSDGNVEDRLVTFTFSQNGLATFDNDTGTALTNADGVATIGLLVGASSGDGLVTGALEDGTAGQVGFSSSGTSQSGVTPASLELYASSIQLASSGSDEIELIAVVKNAQNILLSGVDVSFAANNGAELQIIQGTSTDDGTARASLTSRNNPENRTITATVSSGTFSETIDINIVGTEVNVDGPSSVVLGDTIDVTIKVADSDGNGLANKSVELSASQGNIATSAVTDSEGQVSIQYVASTSGENIITASALNAQGSLTFTVQEDSFSFTTVPSEDVPLNTDTTLEVTWLKDNIAYVGGEVVLSSSRGNFDVTTAMTDNNGVATFLINSNNAGLASITALGTDANEETVSARTQFEFVATEPATVIVDASPDLIGPDGQTSTITAIVRDDTGNLVKGKVINFRVDDVSGGYVSPNSATTDSNGIASTVYTSNAVSSEDAVIVYAEVADDDSVTDFTTLTVGDRAFDISLGTGNLLSSPDDSSYQKEFSVFVSDSVGRAVENVSLTASLTPIKFTEDGVYRKGYWSYSGDVWVANITAICANEDINGNGILDSGEDTNGDGELTPGIIGTIGFTDGNNETDSNGQAKLEVRYPRAFGFWADVEVAVFGQSSGSEAVESQYYTLSVAAEDLDDEAISPPNSPFGTGFSCTDTL